MSFFNVLKLRLHELGSTAFWVPVTAYLGYFASYNKLYLFHIVFGFVIIQKGLVKIKNISRLFSRERSYLPGILLCFLLALASFLYPIPLVTRAKYFCFIFFALFIIFFIKSTYKNIPYQVLKALLWLEISFCLFEMVFHYHLPWSAHYLQPPIETILSVPTGFRHNPNNLAFLFFCSFVFFQIKDQFDLRKGFLLKFALLLMISFVGSRGVYLVMITLLLGNLLLLKKKAIVFCVLAFFVLVPFSTKVFDFKVRSFTELQYSYSALTRFLDMKSFKNIKPNPYSTAESIKERHSTVKITLRDVGLKEFFFGRGPGGTSSRLLVLTKGKKSSLHFFPLEVLLDLGLLPILMLFFICFQRIKKVFVTATLNVAFTEYALYWLSLILMIVGSVTLSSAYYFLPFWLFFSLSLSFGRELVDSEPIPVIDNI